MTRHVWRKLISQPLLLMAGVAALVSTSGCGTSNKLYGSVSAGHSLSFNSVVLGVQATYLTITYMQDSATVAKVALDTNGLTLANGSTLDGNDFLARAAVTRIMSDPNDVFPTHIVRGSINFDNFSLSPGASLSGHFFVTFDTGDLLEGDFSGNLVNQNAAATTRLMPGGKTQPNFDATTRGWGAIPSLIELAYAPKPRDVHVASDAKRCELAAKPICCAIACA